METTDKQLRAIAARRSAEDNYRVINSNVPPALFFENIERLPLKSRRLVERANRALTELDAARKAEDEAFAS